LNDHCLGLRDWLPCRDADLIGPELFKDAMVPAKAIRRPRAKIKHWFVHLLFLLLPLSAQAADYQWPVLSVLDGDSLKVELPGLPAELNPVTVRIRGIDAPEAGSKAKCDAERERADRATAMLEALLG